MDVADDGYYWERIRAKSYYNNLWTPDHTNGVEKENLFIDKERKERRESTVKSLTCLLP